MTMNSTPDHLSDEILSSLLDGDPDAAVEEDGAGVDAAAHLRACDRCAGRQGELASARSALAAAAVEPLDDLTRRRLVATALAAAGSTPAGEAPAAAAVPIGRGRWARRHPGLIGSAAAAVLAVLVGVPFVLDNGAPGGGETLTAQAPMESAGPFLGDLGDLSDRDRLRLRLSGAVSDSYASPPSEAGPSPAAGAPTAAPLADGSPGAGGLAAKPGAAAATTMAPASPVAGSRSSGRQTGGADAASKEAAEPQAADTATANEGFAYNDQSARDRADTDRCVAALLDGPARGGRLIRSGTGTYQGRLAVTASFELSGGTVAFITDRSDCSELDRFSV
jgi:hypothetical protein